MAKKKHSSKLVAIFMLFLLVVSTLALYINFKSKSASTGLVAKIYYYDPIVHELVPVAQTIKGVDTRLVVLDVFNDLKNPPDKSLFPVITGSMKLSSVSISNGVCLINLSLDESELKTISLHREYAAVYGIVNTLTEIKGISEVQFKINGENRKYFSHYVEIDFPLSHFQGSFPKSVKANLFFPTTDFKTLAIEQREIPEATDPLVKCSYILHELFRGSLYGLPGLFSEDMIKNFSIQSGGIAIVDLNETVFNHPLGAHLENLFILSIVNTLTEIHDIESVQIKVNNHVLDSLFGSVDISSPIKRFFGNGDKYLVPYFSLQFNDNNFAVPMPVIARDYSFAKLFELMKKTDTGFITKITQKAKIIKESISEGTLNLVIDLGTVPSQKDMDVLKRTIVLSFTEIPGISKVNLSIGEESFLLGR